MSKRILYLCGMIAPVLFVFMTILGGAIRPGYSHISDTVSDLFSPGSPNKGLLDSLHIIYASLFIAFGIGVLRFVRESRRASRTAVIGASMFLVGGFCSAATATVFPQDAWGSPTTFRGEMHIILSGVVGILSVFSMLLIGSWMDRTQMFPGFRTYSFISVGAVLLTTVFFIANVGGPIMGLSERTTILAGFQWTFVLALWLFSRQAQAERKWDRPS